MALEDVAEFISTRGSDRVLRMLHCFRGGNEPTLDELQDAAGDIAKKTVRHYITLFRSYHLIESYQDENDETRYTLNSHAFKAHIDTELIEPVERLEKKGK